MRSIHGRLDSIWKNARNAARSRSRWLSGTSSDSSAARIAARRSALIRRTTAAKMSFFEP